MKYAIRSQIRAPDGFCLLSLDLSAAESWIVAYLSNDPNMKHELANGDLHSFSARVIYGVAPDEAVTKDQRYIGKKMNHSCGYRTSPIKIAEFINKEGGVTVSVAQTKRWHAKWHQTFMIRQWWMDIEDRLQSNGRTLRTTYGRSRTFRGFWNDDMLKEATAYEPQSTVADHMRGTVHPELNIEGGVRAIQKYLTQKYESIKLINTAHDSVVIECPTNLAEEVGAQCVNYLRRPLIVRGETFIIPVDCDIYPERWGEDGTKLL